MFTEADLDKLTTAQVLTLLRLHITSSDALLRAVLNSPYWRGIDCTSQEAAQCAQLHTIGLALGLIVETEEAQA